jgi:hypothetical protein
MYYLLVAVMRNVQEGMLLQLVEYQQETMIWNV